jgi:hypothetical protein
VNSDERVLLKSYVPADVKESAQRIAAEKRVSISAWVQRLIVEAIEDHEAAKERKALAAKYDGNAPL